MTLVIKVGDVCVTYPAGQMDTRKVTDLAHEISSLKDAGRCESI